MGEIGKHTRVLSALLLKIARESTIISIKNRVALFQELDYTDMNQSSQMKGNDALGEKL